MKVSCCAKKIEKKVYSKYQKSGCLVIHKLPLVHIPYSVALSTRYKQEKIMDQMYGLDPEIEKNGTRLK